MSEYRYLEDIWERNENIFEGIQFSSRGYGKRYYISSAISSAHKWLQDRYVELKAPRDLSPQSISNCRVPTNVLIYFTKEDEMIDKLLRRKCEDYFGTILDFYDKLYKYTIDGKEVSAKEFYEYVKIVDKENEKGEE